MTIPLTIDDPLAGQEVVIVVTVAAGDGPRDGRPVLVSLGLTGQPPIIRTGTFADALALIHTAWAAFGVRAQVAAPAGGIALSEKTAEVMVAVEAANEHEPHAGAAPPPPDIPPPSRPQPQNLSLF
jgi:hypothetical protein